MQGSTQLVLTLSIISLTLVFIIIGVWIILILKELRHSLKRVNKIISEAEAMIDAVAQPIATFSDFWQGAKKGLSLLNWVFKDKEESENEEE